ncbi:hypothetical protein NIF40_10435 [[Clostridium] leptum]|uniref:Uncharacterized protein n=1 Tax=Solibaculum mannosilyticum TaxID=2780922 RepID=A0A7I8D2G5_9FIRM|nr:hypothetical protein [Solibaculum mannosilyticum]MCO7137941.1 hypothetical protein [[Clostridium] leptum]BCI61008.1 hypothetical protein C12CBH8_16470 [Solibaculum mannosilyticum]
MKKIFSIFVLLVVVTTLGYLSVSANELDMERVEEEYHGAAKAISIAADSKGNVALYFDDDVINVYHPDGTFFYGLKLDVASYVCDFDSEDNLIVFATRTDYIYYFNSKGECVKQVYKDDFMDPGALDKYYRERMSLREIDEDGFQYILEASYGKTKLIQQMDDGSERVLYETEGSTVIGKTIFGGVIAILFISLFGLGIFQVYRFYKNSRNKKDSADIFSR